MFEVACFAFCWLGAQREIFGQEPLLRGSRAASPWLWRLLGQGHLTVVVIEGRQNSFGRLTLVDVRRDGQILTGLDADIAVWTFTCVLDEIFEGPFEGSVDFPCTGVTDVTQFLAVIVGPWNDSVQYARHFLVHVYTPLFDDETGSRDEADEQCR